MSYKLRPCAVCGSMMEAWSNRKTCSDKCKQKLYRARKKARYGSVTVANYVRKSTRCRNCGETICLPRLGQEYCSQRCKQAMYRQRKKFASEAPKQLSIPESAYTISNSVP